MSLEFNKPYWYVSISPKDFRLDIERVEIVRLQEGDSRAVVVQLCADGKTIWSTEVKVVYCSNLYESLGEALRSMRTPISNLLHNIDNFLSKRVIGENGVMGELHVPADMEL